MRRTTTLFLILLLLAISPVSHITFQWMLKSVRTNARHKIKETVPEECLVHFSFKSSEQPNWTRPGKEFEYKDMRYDIVRLVTNEDGWSCACISDEDEAMLFAGMNQLTHGDSKNQPDSLPSKVMKVIQFQFVGNFHATPQLSRAEAIISDPTTFGYRFSIKTWRGETNVPPPLA